MLLTIRLIHLNDAHSMLDRASRVSTVIEMSRLVDPSSLFLFAGDALVGTPWYELGGKGELDLQVMEALRPDAYVVGNHDLDEGIDHFRQILGAKRIPLTVANWHIHGPLRYRVKPYRMRTVHGCRVAIIGLSIDPTAYGLPREAGITYQDPERTLAELLPEIKKRERPAAILVVSHLGQATDERLAGFFPEVAAIIGGHSHSVITFPERFFHPNHFPSIVVQAGCSNEYVGLLELDILGGKVANAKGSLLRVSDDISPDTSVEAILAPYRPAMARYEVVIGKAGAAIPLWTRGSFGSPLGDMVADWCRQAAALKLDRPIHLAVLNQTGLRHNLPAGPITKRDVYEIYPFDNALMVTTLTGAQVQAMFNHMATRGGDPISGATFALADNHATDIRIVGKVLQLERHYRVASNSYLIRSGGSGYKVLTQGQDTLDLDMTIRGVMESLIAATPALGRTVDAGTRIQRPPFDLDDEIRSRWGVGIAEGQEPFGRP